MSQDFLLDWSCLMPSGEWEPRERSAKFVRDTLLAMEMKHDYYYKDDAGH